MFDIYDTSTYSEAPDAYAIINGEKIKRKDGTFLTVKELTGLILDLENFFKSQDPTFKMSQTGIDNFFDRITPSYIQKQKEKEELDRKNREALINAQLKNLYAITRKNQFNPRDESTYKYAKSDVITVIDGIPIYHKYFVNNEEKKDYLFETEFVSEIYDSYKLYGKKDYKTIQEFIDKHIKLSLLDSGGYDVKKSDLTINGYNYTIAQKEIIKHLSLDDLQKLTEIIQNHFKNKEKHYRLAQAIWDELAGKIDNKIFAELCFKKFIDEEQSIMYEYYCTFDTIETENELKSLLDNDYLNLYPELKDKIRKWFKEVLEI